jgi:predicted glycosyltransferase
MRVDAYKESFYLHPNYFRPDNGVLEQAGLIPGEKFVILRFVAWHAHHDVGQHGLSNEEKGKLVTELGRHARVLISSEGALPEELEPNRVRIPVHKIHDLLYYAQLLVGDSQTMSTEAAILGTPAVRCNTFVGPKDMSNFVELEHTYGLLFSFHNATQAIQKAIELVRRPDIKSEGGETRERLLSNKVDVTGVLVDQILSHCGTPNA